MISRVFEYQYRLATLIFSFVLFSPWIFMFLLFTMAMGVLAQFGHWPSYGNPDPKQIGALSNLHGLSFFVLVVVILSPLLIPLQFIMTYFFKWEFPYVIPSFILYGSGLILLSHIAVGDPYGSFNWYFD